MVSDTDTLRGVLQMALDLDSDATDDDIARATAEARQEAAEFEELMMVACAERDEARSRLEAAERERAELRRMLAEAESNACVRSDDISRDFSIRARAVLARTKEAPGGE